MLENWSLSSKNRIILCFNGIIRFLEFSASIFTVCCQKYSIFVISGQFSINMHDYYRVIKIKSCIKWCETYVSKRYDFQTLIINVNTYVILFPSYIDLTAVHRLNISLYLEKSGNYMDFSWNFSFRSCPIVKLLKNSGSQNLKGPTQISQNILLWKNDKI